MGSRVEYTKIPNFQPVGEPIYDGFTSSGYGDDIDKGDLAHTFGQMVKLCKDMVMYQSDLFHDALTLQDYALGKQDVFLYFIVGDSHTWLLPDDPDTGPFFTNSIGVDDIYTIHLRCQPERPQTRLLTIRKVEVF